MIETVNRELQKFELRPEFTFSGAITWYFVDMCSPSRSITLISAVSNASGQEIAMEYNCALPSTTSCIRRIVLRRNSSRTFAGVIISDHHERYIGTCTCRCYSDGKHLALIGEWREDGVSRNWIAELRPSV